MELNFYNLSVFDSPELESSISNISFKQFKRSYPGGPTINFALALSGNNDFDVKTYTNFYLTDKFLLSDIVDYDDSILKSEEIATTLSFGNGNDLVFVPRTENYGTTGFNTNTTTTNTLSVFHVQFLDNNICRIYSFIDYSKYYLCVDDTNQLFFVKSRFLPFDSNAINPQDFTYVFSTGVNAMLLFKDTANGFFFLKKSGSILAAEPTTTDNNDTYRANPVYLSRDIYYTPSDNLNFNFITYQGSNNSIDLTKSEFNLKSNFLLHKKYSGESSTDLLVLKNQLHQNDIFSSSNNLLSSAPNSTNLYVDDLREYTAICGDIKEEISSDLELNYVFFNKTYEIKPGKTLFVTPSSMYPFTKLNINNSKFIDSGSFSYVTPEFADKVYRLSKQKQNLDAGQYLLCTWLSGSIYGQKVWMDRYFYPDLIKKEEAIALKPFLAPTYDDIIEDLINTNTGLKSSLTKIPIFDKISDMVFEPNQEYIYERLQAPVISETSQTVTTCDIINNNIPLNYFKDINTAGEFSIYFTFDGNDEEWVVYSDRNEVDAGVKITKGADTITIEYTLFDPSNYDSTKPISMAYQTFSTAPTAFKKLKKNYISVSFDSVEGLGYFTLNNEIVPNVYGETPPISMSEYTYYTKNILYGDFFVDNGGVVTNLLLMDSFIKDFQIFDEFLDVNLALIMPVLNGDIDIDTIYLSLPCGMRNSIDNMDLLQHICASSSFKSNNINIILKNLHIDNEDVIQSIKNNIVANVERQIPANTTIKEIKVENYL